MTERRDPSPGGDARALLETLPILRFLPADARTLVVSSFVPASCSYGSVIVREGEKADAFFVLASGKARVVKEGAGGGEVSLNVLRPGDSFGEAGLLDPDATRTATVRASSDVEFLRLDRTVFDALLRIHPQIRTSFELQVRHRSLHNFFRLYGPFAKLPATALGELLNEFQPVSFAKGTVVFRQGDPPGPLFVVEEGRLRVFAEEEGERRPLSYLRKGDFFGEISVFKGGPRTATVEAVSPCRLLALPAKAFQKAAAEHPALRAAIEKQIEQYDFRKIARVPLDFAEELLPADAQMRDVSPDQVDQEVAGEEEGAAREAPFATADGQFVKRAKRIRRFPHVRQIDEMDCGAACTAMICRYYGRAVSLSRIRQLLSPPPTGRASGPSAGAPRSSGSRPAR